MATWHDLPLELGQHIFNQYLNASISSVSSSCTSPNQDLKCLTSTSHAFNHELQIPFRQMIAYLAMAEEATNRHLNRMQDELDSSMSTGVTEFTVAYGTTTFLDCCSEVRRLAEARELVVAQCKEIMLALMLFRRILEEIERLELSLQIMQIDGLHDRSFCAILHVNRRAGLSYSVPIVRHELFVMYKMLESQSSRFTPVH